MKRKKIIIIAVAAIVTLFVALKIMKSQMTPKDKAQHLTEKMTKKLDLTETQTAAVYALNLQKVENRHNDYETREEKKSSREVSQVAWKEGLQDVLTAEQLEKIKQ